MGAHSIRILSLIFCWIAFILNMPASSAAPKASLATAPEVSARAGTPCTFLAGTRSSPTGSGIVRPKAAQAPDGTIIAVADGKIVAFDNACGLVDGPISLAKFFVSTGVGANEVFGFWDVMFSDDE